MAIDQEDSFLLANLAGLTILNSGLNHLHGGPEDFKIAKHGEEIEQLKRELNQKDKEITELKNNVKHLEENNNDLLIKLEARNDEVRKLKERIQKLESEKKELQEQLASVKYKLERVEKDVESLVQAKEAQDDVNSKLEESLRKVHSKLDTVKSDLEKTKGDNKTLKKDLKTFKESTTQQRALELAMVPGGVSYPARPSLLPSGQSVAFTETRALIFLGELCWDLQGRIYKYVLPEHYTPIRSYKVKKIEKDINKLTKTRDECVAAEKRWQFLQETLKWDSEKYEEAMKSLQESRNIQAHPKITEDILTRSAEEMDRRGMLKGWLSHQCIRDLIDMWKEVCRLSIQ